MPSIELERRGVEYVKIDDDEVIFDLNEGRYPYDVVLERSIHHSRALYALKALNDAGVPTVNSAAVADVCGDKFKTTQALIQHGIPTPRTRMAFTPASLFAVHFRPARSRMLPPCWRMRPSMYHMVHAEECMAKSNPSRAMVLPCILTSFWPTRPMSSQVRG